MRCFVSGIDTGVGKTVVSAILAKAWECDYWKPVQAGDLRRSDSILVHSLTDASVHIHPETYRLKTPMSPHASAALDGVTLDIGSCIAPMGPVVVEGAGGLLAPLNETQTNMDLIQHLQLPVVLVSKHYLGSINHTLLSIAALNAAAIQVIGIVFVGTENISTETAISGHGGTKILGRIPWVENINSEFVNTQIQEVRQWTL